MPLERGRHLSTASRSSSGDSSPEGWLPHEGHRRSAVPALIADAGDLAGWRYVEFFTANIRNPNTRRAYARACSQFLRLVRRARPDSDDDPAARCRHLYRKTPADPFGAGRETAAGGGADAVRLADHWPDRAGEPGRGRARSEACRENWQDRRCWMPKTSVERFVGRSGRPHDPPVATDILAYRFCAGLTLAR